MVPEFRTSVARRTSSSSTESDNHSALSQSEEMNVDSGSPRSNSCEDNGRMFNLVIRDKRHQLSFLLNPARQVTEKPNMQNFGPSSSMDLKIQISWDTGRRGYQLNHKCLPNCPARAYSWIPHFIMNAHDPAHEFVSHFLKLYLRDITKEPTTDDFVAAIKRLKKLASECGISNAKNQDSEKLPKAKKINTKYTEEECDFVIFCREELRMSWNDVLLSYSAYFIDRTKRRSVQAPQARFYRDQIYPVLDENGTPMEDEEGEMYTCRVTLRQRGNKQVDGLKQRGYFSYLSRHVTRLVKYPWLPAKHRKLAEQLIKQRNGKSLPGAVITQNAKKPPFNTNIEFSQQIAQRKKDLQLGTNLTMTSGQ